MIRLKINYLWRVFSGLFILLLALNVALAQTESGTSAKDLGLNSYRHFLIYPHFEKAMKAQKNNNEAVALREFKHIHQLAPDSIPLIMYLVEAYRYFGHHDLARALLEEQLIWHPNNAELERQIEALELVAAPVPTSTPAFAQITTVAELRLQQKRCDAAPDTQCRSAVGQNALKLAQLEIALDQLTDPEFAAQEEGKALFEGVLQRAIYLKKWVLVEKIFKFRSDQGTLSTADRQQWFNSLIQGHLDKQFLALQAQGIFNSAAEQITYASSLLERGEQAQLERYLVNNKPSFKTASQEKRWLYLLSNKQVDKYETLANYLVKFPENLDFVAGQTLAIAIKEKDHSVAQRILNTLANDAYLNERYEVSRAVDDRAETLRVVRKLYKQNPSDINRLDQLSWTLVESGLVQEAAQLLMASYPFSGSKAITRTLITRLSGLLAKSPNLATAKQNQVLLRPLSTPALREFQSTLSWFTNDCKAIQTLFGDLSSSYGANTWKLLAGCYQDALPGLALYAFQQAEKREPSDYNHRAVAYQAYQVQDYKEAQRAWRAVPIPAMSDQDLMAATNTAQQANDAAARDLWLLEQKKRGMDNTEHYWRLHAQRYLPDQPELALVDLNRAIRLEPSAQAYAARSTIYRQQGNLDEAVKDLRKGILLDPENKILQAALGYALWDKGDVELARQAHEISLEAMPDNEALVKQLVYENQRLDDIPQAQKYARQVIDGLDHIAQADPLTLNQNQERFDFRRLHEDIDRRWTFNLGTTMGLNAGSVGSVNPVIGSTPGKSYRSYGQVELDYRIGRNKIIDGDLLSVYGRVFADTGTSDKMFPIRDPMLGLGIRWKPLRDSIFFVALERQQPLRYRGSADTMVRMSASFLNNGKFSDEWHPNGKGWFAQNLYLDAAHYIRKDRQSWAADYRLSWHQKVAEGQTIEPYAHIQTSGYKSNFGTQGAHTVGVGARWNLWAGGNRYDAWPHKVSVGFEYQRVLKNINQTNPGKRDNVFFTLGIHW